MSPFVRGRVLPETTSTGQAKTSLDVLLWLPRITAKEFAELDIIEVLRNYLASMTPARCSVTLWLPTTFQETANTLLMFDVAFKPIQVSKPGDNVKGMLKSGDAALGTWVTIGNPEVAEILANVGFDWLVLVIHVRSAVW